LDNVDKDCRRQQVGEGHFGRLEDVPSYAITVTIPALCLARKRVSVVPEARKAKAVRAALEGPIFDFLTRVDPAQEKGATLFLDRESSKLLSGA
jgi:glucosamine-6-phosphate deaminase